MVENISFLVWMIPWIQSQVVWTANSSSKTQTYKGSCLYQLTTVINNTVSCLGRCVAIISLEICFLVFKIHLTCNTAKLHVLLFADKLDPTSVPTLLHSSHVAIGIPFQWLQTTASSCYLSHPSRTPGISFAHFYRQWCSCMLTSYRRLSARLQNSSALAMELVQFYTKPSISRDPREHGSTKIKKCISKWAHFYVRYGYSSNPELQRWFD